MTFTPVITSASRVDEVVAKIRQFVERGQLAPGSRLPSEPELAGQLRISRNVLREAIKRLESIGLVVVRRGLGTFVGDGETLSTTAKLVRSAMALSPKDVTKVAELRRAIECDAVRRAAMVATADDIRELEELYAESKAAYSIQQMESDIKFHMKIVKLADNPLMLNVMEVIQEFIYAGIMQTKPVEEAVPYGGGGRDQHLDILDAIRAHDADRAEQAVRSHMDLLTKRLAHAAASGVPKAKPAAGASEYTGG